MYPVVMASSHSVALTKSDASIDLPNIFSRVISTVICSGIITIGAQLELRLPYTPVPITGQSLSVVLCGLLFGRNVAVAGTITYLLEGIAGLPVLSGGGSGIHHLFGPTGGYLIGFIPAAFISGTARDKRISYSPIGIFATVITASLPIFAFGVCRLWMLTDNLSTALTTGLYPFIPGDFVKAIVASMITPISQISHNKRR